MLTFHLTMLYFLQRTIFYKYGNRKINDVYKQKYKLESQLLHAYRLELPELNGELENISLKQFTAPIPKLFERILNEEKNNKG